MDTGLFALDRRAGAPALYRQVAAAISSAIEHGVVLPGERLPSERQLADQIGVSRMTTVYAYQELKAGGWIRGQVGRGTFVCAPAARNLPATWRDKLSQVADRSLDDRVVLLERVVSDVIGRSSPAPDVITFAIGRSALDVFPVDAIYDLLADTMRRVPDAVLQPGPPAGVWALRHEIGRRLGTAGDSIMVLADATHGLDLIARRFLDPGDTVIIEQPAFRGSSLILGAAGAQVIGWDCVSADLDRLEDLFIRYRPKLISVNPTFHNPTGLTLSIAIRRDLLELAARYQVLIVESDLLRELYFHSVPPPSLFQLDSHGIVVHLGTLARVAGDALGLSWIAAAPGIIDRLVGLQYRRGGSSNMLIQLALTEFIKDGLLDAYLVQLRAEHLHRLQTMTGALRRLIAKDRLDFREPAGGLFLWGRLAGDLHSWTVLESAIREGVVFINGENFYIDGRGTHALRLCFTDVPDDQIVEGVRRLAPLLR